ncbi:MerR family transcriptional regulator [Nonomuraea ferruginea]|uniref:MerR family transcriptional regulator n=1 Tax=Nonomuraea ferruginea TaxID=46174 RepID=A0ABT4SU26_9ACTN|nr:MerR family transcriptional regulator [Nonomuraea ferruginea]MDA0640540.1 MerR family transcriptional regulator [Nonomuraea ferruginea]
MDDNETYPIGDVARRTGLSVSAIRYYSDAGVIAPTHVTEAGYRLYDVRAIARLELIRTLRDLDAGLDDIRRLLGGETSLHDLLATHLELVERQERDLRARRAVLRTLVKQGGTAAKVALMRKLVSMPDEERERLIDDFWNEVGENLDVPPGFVERLRTMRPRLPEDPTAAQLEAWIELADLVRGEEFRGAVRSWLQDTYGTFPGRRLADAPVWDFIHQEGMEIGKEVLEAYRSGLPADSPRSRELVVGMADATAGALAGGRSTAESRERLATAFLMVEEIQRSDAEENARYDATHGRYLSLVAVINGTPPDTGDDGPALFAWIAAALRASAR